MELIDGAAIAAKVRAELQPRVDSLRARGVVPGLVAVLVGDDAASASYVRGKARASTEMGINGRTLHLAAGTTQPQLMQAIEQLNGDPLVHGVIVQMPVPHGIDGAAATRAVSPDKDVDGLHPVNLGLLLRGEGWLLPATPAGVQQLLCRSGHGPSGKHVVIVGRSNLVGKPLAALLMQKGACANATVTVCHTATPDLAALTRQADILVTSLGRPGSITAEFVRPGATVIDVGTSRVPDTTRKSGYRLSGDVDVSSVAGVAGAITPVPGGVGPMTIAMLLSNTVLAAERQTNPPR